MDTEDLIKEALRLRADQAPPDWGVLSALHRPRRSRKPLFLAVTAATAAVAVAVVATAVGRPAAEAPPAGGGTVAPTTSSEAPSTAVAAPADPFTLGYSPSWLPEGLTERHRFVDATGSLQRVWKHNGGQVVSPSFELVVPKDVEAQDRLRRQVEEAAAAHRVTINGRTALVADPADLVEPLPGETKPPAVPDGTPPDTRVVLNPEPGRYLQFTLSNAVDARAEAIRVAESMRPDPASLRGPVSLGGEVAHQARVNSQGWLVSTTGVVDGVAYGVNLSSYVDDPGGTQSAPVAVTARGASAEYLGDRGGYLRVDLGPDLHLLVHGPGPGAASAQDLVAVAEAVTIDANPGLPWAGN